MAFQTEDGLETLLDSGEVLDVSRSISPESVVYPGDDDIAMEKVSNTRNSAFGITFVEWTTHLLTHIDAPSHFVEGGKDLDDVSLGKWIGKAEVIEVEGDAIEPENIPDSVSASYILFKTSNSEIPTTADFEEDHVHLSQKAAEKLVERDVNLAGIDYINIEEFGNEEFPAHKTLLEKEVLILEGLDLGSVEPGKYFLVALPLKIKGKYGDGSPVRAVLIDN